MRVVRRLVGGIRSLMRRRREDEDVAAEVQHFWEESAAAHLTKGLTPAEARRAAHLELGGVTQVREQVRRHGWESHVEDFFTDLRYGARGLRAAPAFSSTAVVTLAVGIGAATAIFSAVHPVLFEPLPYPEAKQVTTVWEIGRDGHRLDATFGMYHGLKARTRSFELLAVMRAWQPTFTGGTVAERLEGQRVSADYFRALGVAPALGRAFSAEDDHAGAPAVVILSHGLWQRSFGGDTGILGREIPLDGAAHRVVGVMPSDFENVLAPAAGIWAPLQYDLSQGRAWGHHLRMIGRLRHGVSVAEAERELSVLGKAVIAEHRPETYGTEATFLVTRLQEDITRAVKPALLAVLGAVVLVLAMACVNVTNLLLARGARRKNEFLLRTALGAPAGRLVRQLLTENVLLAAVGGVAGLAVAAAATRGLIALAPAELPRANVIGVNGSAFTFAVCITLLVGLAFGLAPAWQAVRAEQGPQIHGQSRVVGRRGRLRAGLVVTQVALALILLATSGLLLRSLKRLFAVDPGFDASHLLTLQVQTAGQRLRADSATHRFFLETLDVVRLLPGVHSAAFTSQLPLSGDFDLYGVHFLDDSGQGEVGGAFRYAVSPGYFETMGIPIVQGRSFNDYDRAGAPRVAVISEAMARRRLPGVDPIGTRLRIGAVDGPPFTVVGVVADVKQVALDVRDADAVYVPHEQWHFADRARTLVIRGLDDPSARSGAFREAIRAIDPDQPVVRVAMMADLVRMTAAQRRFALITFEAFALAALILAGAGLYGVLSSSVAERYREIGVRSALGATRRGILGLILREGLTLTLAGISLGMVGAAAASQAVAPLLFDVSRLDMATYAIVALLLTLVALVACAGPAWRASRLDPTRTLRAD